MRRASRFSLLYRHFSNSHEGGPRCVRSEWRGVRSESDEEKPGAIIDFDERGDVVGFEILDASERVGAPRQMEFVTVG